MGLTPMSKLDRISSYQPFDASTDVANVSARKASVPKSPQKLPEIFTRPRPPAVHRYWQSPDISLIPEPGRINQDFAASAERRLEQAKKILLSWNRWPTTEGEVFAIQIDQDSPKPAGRGDRFALFKTADRAGWLQGLAELQSYVTTYTGRLVLVRSVRRYNTIELEHLNPGGVLRAASHPGQIDPAGQGSCTGGVCGMAWLRPGVYEYSAKDQGVFNPLDDHQMAVARDSNGDGVISVDESMASARSYGMAIQIHAGFPKSPRSVGCQTLPPVDFEIFRKLIRDSNRFRFSYILMRRPNDRSGTYYW